MSRLLPVVLAIVCMLAAGPIRAQEDSAPTGDVEVSAGHVAVPEPGERAMRYYRSGNVLWAVNLVWVFGLYGALLFTGFSARLRDLARAVGRNRFGTVVVYAALFTALVYVLQLPLAWYQGFARPHAYDLSNQTLSKWFLDYAKQLALSVVFWSMFLWIPYLLLARSPRRWWLYSGIITVPVVVIVILIHPIWVAPQFHEFTALKDPDLEAKILDLAGRAGIEGAPVYEAEMSTSTKKLGAYVTGFMGTKRIVLFDNLVEKMDDDEILFVVAHESAHYVLGHVLRTIVVTSALILGGLWLAHRLSDGILRRFSRRLGFDKLSDVASLPLILFMLELFLFLAVPAALAYSRHMERQADRFGLELAQNNHAAATAFVKLQNHNLGNPRPGPLFMLWRSTHPSLGERIDFANTYAPWKTGAPLTYADYFKN